MRKRFRIGGRVQGIGFRFYTRHMAGVYGVSGWVRNLADGGVEAEAQGTPEQLSRFEAELRSGPSGAQVADFTATEISDQDGSLNRFEIRH